MTSDVDVQARTPLSRTAIDEDFVFVTEDLDEFLPLRGWSLWWRRRHATPGSLDVRWRAWRRATAAFCDAVVVILGVSTVAFFVRTVMVRVRIIDVCLVHMPIGGAWYVVRRGEQSAQSQSALGIRPALAKAL